MSGPDLSAELASAALAIKIMHFRTLERLGVARDTLCERWRHDWGFGVAPATAGEDELYVPGEGPPHLILPVYDDGELVDLCAFRSADPTRWLLRTGQGWALGLERGLMAHAWGDPVPLAVSPLEWMRQGCVGLCVLDWSAPEVRYLLEVPHLVCSSRDLAAMLRAKLATPVRFPTISIEEARLVA
jgi:hypothetical protein